MAILNSDLYECDECAAKPGSPTLCPRCQEARTRAGPAWVGWPKPKPKLARFRADPRRVRVSWRKMEPEYGVTCYRIVISSTDPGVYTTVERTYRGTLPVESMMIDMLKRAAAANIPGIDLHMQWSYDHPWETE